MFFTGVGLRGVTDPGFAGIYCFLPSSLIIRTHLPYVTRHNRRRAMYRLVSAHNTNRAWAFFASPR